MVLNLDIDGLFSFSEHLNLQRVFLQLSLFKEAIEDMATRSLRCVAIAYRMCEMDKVPTSEEELENWQLPEGDLILLAIVGIKVLMVFLALV